MEIVGSGTRKGGVGEELTHRELPNEPVRISWCLSLQVLCAETGGCIPPSKHGKLHTQSLGGEVPTQDNFAG